MAALIRIDISVIEPEIAKEGFCQESLSIQSIHNLVAVFNCNVTSYGSYAPTSAT